MNIYLISQTEEKGYDTYDSAVVIAADEDAARKTYPSALWHCDDEGSSWPTGWRAGSEWCATPEAVTVKLIGCALPDAEAGVVCASFNAG